ncbi:MAG: hypothetical protein R3222_01065, partial [Balneolaceae bacterium]|nr:hypothetical protein [Balneolaceae bacterium]
FSLLGENLEPRIYSMDNEGNGEYNLSISALPQGIYEFEATARKGDRVIDQQKGEISISRSNAEYTDTRRNDALLQSISSNTGANQFIYYEASAFRDSLNTKGMLDKKEEVITDLFYPYQHSFWFVMVIILLAAEWTTRKYLALA